MSEPPTRCIESRCGALDARAAGSGARRPQAHLMALKTRLSVGAWLLTNAPPQSGHLHPRMPDQAVEARVDAAPQPERGGAYARPATTTDAGHLTAQATAASVALIIKRYGLLRSANWLTVPTTIKRCAGQANATAPLMPQWPMKSNPARNGGSQRGT